MCLVGLFRRQWTESERLTYPTVYLPMEMTGDGFWNNRGMWLGFAIAAHHVDHDLNRFFRHLLGDLGAALPHQPGTGPATTPATPGLPAASTPLTPSATEPQAAPVRPGRADRSCRASRN